VNELVKFMKAHNIPLDGISSSGRTRVLLVDDDKEIVETLARILTEQTNYEVQVRSPASRRGCRASRFKPHVLLMDIHLGAMATAARWHGLRPQERAAPVHQDHRDERQAHRRPGPRPARPGLRRYFLKKPFQVRQVVESIENVMNVVH
jgi:DNA-binding NtrC family response regulator